MDAIRTFWMKNGTKVIGYLTVAIAFLASADPNLVGPLLGDRGLRWMMLVSGLLTALRGHTNTAQIKDEVRVEEKAKEQVKVEKAVEDIYDGKADKGQGPG